MPSESTILRPATRHTLTRREVAERLGVSTSTVRRMEFDRLHPVEDEQGVWRFDPAELEGIEPRARRQRAPTSEEARERQREGRIAARVFLLFARNASLARIVVTTKQTPERVRALYHEWVTSLEEGEWACRPDD